MTQMSISALIFGACLRISLLVVLYASALLVDLPDHSERNKNLIGLLQRERIRPEHSKDIPPALEVARKWKQKNATGHEFECTEFNAKKVEAENGDEKEELAPISQTYAFSQAALDARISLLRGTCVTHDGGWWTTRWCHATEVRQSHFEGAREVTSYSLGSFAHGQVKFSSEMPHVITGDTIPVEKSATPLFYVESFDNGQVCDETGEPRRTEVRLYCCPKDRAVSLVSLQETTICQYTMTLCWASLCEAGLPPLSPNSRDTWSAVRPLTGLCFRNKAETGWTHEVCFEKSARAFRQVPARELSIVGKKPLHNGQRVLEVDVKRLGTFSPLKTFNEKGETIVAQQPHVGEAKSPSDDDDGSDHERERAVLQVYSGGDVCEGEERFTTHVKIACFLTKAAAPEIVSVRWTSNCQTLVLLHSPGLCDADDEKRLRYRSRMRNQQQRGNNNAVKHWQVLEADEESSDVFDVNDGRVTCVPI